MTIASKIGIPVSKELFTKGILEISKGLTSKIDKKLRILNTESKIHELFRKIYNVRKVKTLWQMEKPADITSFYHTPKLELKKGRKSEIHSVSDIEISNNVVLLGIAGQGKSMLMRQLCVSELAKGERIPLFIELRKVSNEINLKRLIDSALEILDIDTDKRVLDHLCRESKICLLLDGFDEISEKFLGRTVLEIEQFVDKYDSLKVIISSRPDSGTDGLRSFHRATICDLEGKDYQAVIMRLLGEDNDDLYEEIVDKIESNNNGIKQFLNTPLMVTLLLIKYKLTKDIPENFSAFYDGVLDVLLTRHDSLKPGYMRQRKCLLSDHDFREVFESLTFNLSGRAAIISEDCLYEATKRALEEYKHKCRPDAFITDLIKITCLLLKDGHSYRFIHKSVQEYYSAAYISRKSETWVKTFFEKIREKNYYRRMEASISFLSELDQYKWNAYFLKPMLEHVIGGYAEGESISDVGRRIFKLCGVGGSTSLRKENPFYIKSFSVSDEAVFLSKFGLNLHQIFAYLADAFRTQIQKKTTAGEKLEAHLNCSFEELVEHEDPQHLLNALEKALHRATRRLSTANEFIGRSTAAFKGFAGI